MPILGFSMNVRFKGELLPSESKSIDIFPILNAIFQKIIKILLLLDYSIDLDLVHIFILFWELPYF